MPRSQGTKMSVTPEKVLPLGNHVKKQCSRSHWSNDIKLLSFRQNYDRQDKNTPIFYFMTMHIFKSKLINTETKKYYYYNFPLI